MSLLLVSKCVGRRHVRLRGPAIHAVLLLMLLLALPSLASAQDPARQWERLYRAAADAPLHGQGGDALQNAQKALELAESVWGPDHPNVAASLTVYAELYSRFGPSTDAFSDVEGRVRYLHLRALDIRRRHPTPDRLDEAESLTYIAEHDARAGRHADALDGYRQALAIREKALGPSSPTLVSSLARVGDELVVLDRSEAARAYHERELEISENPAVDDRDVLREREIEIARMHDFRGDTAYAEQVLERALRADERAFGPISAPVSRVLVELASHYRGPEYRNKARSTLERVLAIDQKVHGSASPEAMDSLYRLADHHVRYREFELAETRLDQAIEIAERSPAVERRKLANALSLLAEVHEKTGRTESAVALRRRSHAVERALKPVVDSMTGAVLVVLNVPLLFVAIVAVAVIGYSRKRCRLALYLGLFPHALFIVWAAMLGAELPLLAGFTTALCIVVAYVLRSATDPDGLAEPVPGPRSPS